VVETDGAVPRPPPPSPSPMEVSPDEGAAAWAAVVLSSTFATREASPSLSLCISLSRGPPTSAPPRLEDSKATFADSSFGRMILER
jgi:hypothetical protein